MLKQLFAVISLTALTLNFCGNARAEDVTSLSSAEAAFRDGKFEQAEAQYRHLLNEVQLEKGFGHADVVPILNGLVPVLRKNKKSSEADAAERLAGDIKKGAVPLGGNAQAYLRHDKKIAIFRRIEATDQAFGFAHPVFSPGEEPYLAISQMLTGVAPGEGRFVPAGESALDEAMGLVDIQSDGAKLRVSQKYNYRYFSGSELKTVTKDNDQMALTILMLTGLLVNHGSKISELPEYIAAFKKDAEQLPINDRLALMFFLQPKTGINDSYAWIVGSNFPGAAEAEEIKLLNKSFPTVDRFSHEYLERKKQEKK